jgi:predicted nuclease of restriction endonuclease-like RecB superfamily
MLTADLIRPRLGRSADRVWTRPIGPADPTYLRIAADLIGLFQHHLGQPRGTLEAVLEEYEGASLEYPIIRGLAKVLFDVSQFASEPPITPAELRLRLFRLAAQRGPVVSQPDLVHATRRETLLAEVAVELSLQPETADEALYADLAEEQVLRDLSVAWTPQALIERYNLELARGLLYWASEMRIVVRDRFKDVFRYVKLFKLMHTVQPLGDWATTERATTEGRPYGPGRAYRITLDGPISPFVQATIRYGRQLAKFLPALLLCKGWSMEADVYLPDAMPGKKRDANTQYPLKYRLDDRCGLKSHYPASGEFDSRLEADFAAEFQAKFGDRRGPWELAREDEIIVVGDTVMIPDFSFTHRRDGRRALLEIAGFWHPNYIRRKIEKLRQADRPDLVVLVYQGVNCTEETWADVPGEVLYFKNKPVLKDVLAAIERAAR